MLQTQNDLQKMEREQRVNVLAAGLAGILAGATGVTLLALSDKDIRRKVGKRAKEVRDALHQWSAEKIFLLHKEEEKLAEMEKLEDVSQKHEEKLHN